MWTIKEDLPQSNENLKNTISKQTRIHSINGSFFAITQLLSETSLSCDVPFNLMNLWINYYSDAAELLRKTSSKYRLTDKSQKDSFINKTSIEQFINTLTKKFKDFEKIFNYYLSSTQDFFSHQRSRVRRSPLKKVENLNFVPLNLHVEQFVVDNEISSSSEKRCYEFTTVGAFTTAHTNKLTNMKPIEQLMMSDKPFEFNNNAGTKQNLIENTIVLHFYSLKVFIQILNELATINEKPNPENEELIQFEETAFKANSNENQLINSVRCVKSKLEDVSKYIIESYEALIEQNIHMALIDKKQQFYNMKEKLGFFRDKMNSFIIEIDSLLTSKTLDKLDGLFQRLTALLIELYVVLFDDSICQKSEFINSCATFCQALTTLIASLDVKYYKNTNTNEKDYENAYNFHLYNGILFHVESVLSCFSNEYYMVYDHYNALQNLNHVFIHLPSNRNDLLTSPPYFFVDIQSDGFHVYLYSSYETATSPIRVYPVLVNVGINEQSYTSHFLGANLLQKFINTQSILKLISYYEHLKLNLKDSDFMTLEVLFNQLKTNKSLVDNSRPVELLQKMSEISRMINGVRVTNCKSGKDRTAMSVSLEQAMLLVRNHGLPEGMMQPFLDDVRRNGTRIDVVKKNIGQPKYAFNKVRYFLLPKLYRPPADLCDELET